MNEKKRKGLGPRHTLPIILTLASVLSLLYRIWNPGFFSNYSLAFLFFFALLIATTAQAWRITTDERKWLTFSRRLAAFPILQCVVIVACTIFFLDLSSNLFQIAIHAMERNLSALGFLSVGSVFLVLTALSSTGSHKVLSKACLLAVSLCFSVVLVEALFRWYLLVPMVPQTEEHFKQIVSSRWPEPIPPEKHPATYRILGLADSFGQAGGRQNYHYLLADTPHGLSERYEVVNLSVVEYEPPDQLALLRRFGSNFAPDLVLQGFFVGNDFLCLIEPLLRFHRISIRATTGYRAVLPHNFAIRKWLRRLSTFKRDRLTKRSEQKRGHEVGSFSRDEFLRIEAARLSFCDLRRSDESLLQIRNVLDKISEQVVAMGAEHVIVIHPDQYQVETGLFREICEQYQLRPENYDLQRPQRLITEYCCERGIDYIDLLPAFRRQGADGGLYLLRDTHYNDQGNRLAASEIAKFLNRRFALREPASDRSLELNETVQQLN